MKVLYFGSYDPNYARSTTLIHMLEECGFEVVMCTDRSSLVPHYFQLLSMYRSVKTYDLMIVGHPGHRDLVVGWILAKLRRKKIMYDAYISAYDTVIHDYEKYSSRFIARLYWLFDKLTCALPDVVLLDTLAHIRYFRQQFGLKRQCFMRVLIGADETIYYPCDVTRYGPFTVVFYGYYNPMQGVQYIIRAAKMLEEDGVQFRLIGKGAMYSSIRQLAKDLCVTNVTFVPPLSQERLAQEIAYADCGLGIFGHTPKARRVFPNKAYHMLAMKKALITGDTPAIREVLEDDDFIGVPMKDPSAIAEAILALKYNSALRKRVAASGYRRYKEKASPKAVARQLDKVLRKLAKNSGHQ